MADTRTSRGPSATAGYAIVRADDVDDVYAGTDVPGEFRRLSPALSTEQLAVTLIRVPPHSDFEQGTGHYHAEIEEVYLVTRGTLEEKILNLQRFKIDVASTVVNQQNAGLGTMETGEILDLFNLGETDPNLALEGGEKNNEVDESNAVDAEGNLKEKGKKGILDELSELWDEKQYEEEFNLDGFLKTMKA